MVKRTFLSMIGLALLASSVAVAQDASSYPLSLADSLRMALDNNLDLVSARKDPEIAAERIDGSKAPFDPVLSAGGNFSQADGDEIITFNPNSPTPIVDSGSSASDVISGDVSLNHLLPYGGQYTVTYDYLDVDFGGTSIQAATGFLTETTFLQQKQGFSLAYEMPLLNGLGKEDQKLDVLLARSGLDISKEDLRQQAILTLKSVEDAYWDTLAASQALRVSRLALERAEELLVLNRKKVEVGTLAPIEITEAEAGVAGQVEAVIVAEAQLENAEDVLLQLLAVPQDDPRWGGSLEITDRPSFSPVEIDLDEAITTALDQRPEMINARQRLRDNELSERVAKRRVRHRLDLTAGLTPNKPDDTERLVRTLSPPNIPDSNSATDREDTDWNVGLRYTFPIRNRAARTNYAISKLNTEKTGIAVRSMEQDIRVDVRVAVRNLDSGSKRVEAARKNVELQREKLEAEQKKFDNGMSTSFEVLRFQNDLADAERREIQARLDYVKSITDLERSKGTLLEARGLSLGN